MLNTSVELHFVDYRLTGVAFVCSQAFDLPETENHGGLLGYDRQDLYVSMSLQAANGRQQQSVTRAQEGMNGSVTWGGDKISFKCSNADDTVIAEVWDLILSQRHPMRTM